VLIALLAEADACWPERGRARAVRIAAHGSVLGGAAAFGAVAGSRLRIRTGLLLLRFAGR